MRNSEIQVDVSHSLYLHVGWCHKVTDNPSVRVSVFYSKGPRKAFNAFSGYLSTELKERWINATEATG